MRVFELARELNIPGKDLIERMKAFGFEVEGNFNKLDDKTITEVKSKMLEPVTRVTEEAAQAEESSEEPQEQPRKRRIISARRSGEARKIKKSLGIDGPLPEDQKTREEVTPAAGDPELAEPVSRVVEDEPPPPKTDEAEVDEVSQVEDESAPIAAETAESTQDSPEKITAVGRHQAPRPIEGMPLPKPVDVSPDTGKPPMERDEWRDMKRQGRKRGEGARGEVPGRGGHWRDMKREKRQGGWSGGEDEWGRPRRGRDRKSKRGPRTGKDDSKHTFNPRQKAVRIGDQIRVSEFAGAIGIKASEIIAKLIALGVMATVNDNIDSATAELIASEFNVELEVTSSDVEALLEEESIDPAHLVSRPPIVTIMGHVDHGKTTLLDFIRSSRIVSGEAGGITQHIGAYHVSTENGDIVFLDTPGHEAFTALRQRGASVTDIVVLIVAADDGVMPQTVEAIDHARAAEVPIIVAMNKMDRPNADPEKIKRQLMENSLVPEELGGDVVLVPISALSGEGVPNLLEIIHLQAEMLELKSTEKGLPRGRVIESQVDRRKGPVATIIVERGTLKVGDHFVAGATYGRIRAMQNDQDEVVDSVTPSIPVEVLGFNTVPNPGDLFAVMEDEKTARDVAEKRLVKRREEETQGRRLVHLEDFLQQTQGEEKPEESVLNIVLKADTQGSLEAIRASLEREGDERIKVHFIRAGVGGITETDVSLATTSNAVVIGFNVRPETKADLQGRAEGVDLKTYTVIYELVDDVHAALQGLLRPVMREEIAGHLEVRDVFTNTKEGKIAGGYVNDGKFERNSSVRVYRDDVLIHTGQLNSLRRFKDDVSSVQSGFECGFRVANFNDLREGDLIEAFTRVEEAAKLERAGRA